MFGSAVLDTAIGLVTIYLMLSLVCSVINEGIASRTQRRGRFLMLGVARLLGEGSDAKTTTPPSLDALRKGRRTKKFLDDSRFQSLTQSPHSLPSYMPQDLAGAIIFDIVVAEAPQGEAAMNGREVRTPLDELGAVLRLAKAAPKDGPDDVPRRLAIDAIEHASRQSPPLVEDDALSAVQRIEQALGAAFAQTMARVGGWYRRRTQVVLLVSAIVVVSFINADSVKLIEHLSLNEATRIELAQVGQQTAAGNRPTDSTDLSNGTSASPNTASAKELINRTRGIMLPLGWRHFSLGIFEEPDWIRRIILKGAGLLLTIFAIVLGAPLWFDVLQKLVSIRATGTKPTPSLILGGGPDGDDEKQGGGSGSGGPSAPSIATATAVDAADRRTVTADGLPSNAPDMTGSAIAPTVASSGALNRAYWRALIEEGPWSPLSPGAGAPGQAEAARPWSLLLRMAQLASLAYRPHPAAKSMLESLGFTEVDTVDAKGTQAFVAKWGADVVVAYRGTETSELADLIADAKIMRVEAAALRLTQTSPQPPLGRIHSGFLNAWRATCERVEAAIEARRGPQGRVWFIGHSLGGALATLHCLARRVEGDSPASLRLVTFGAPRVGDLDLSRGTTDLLRDVGMWRVEMERDPVPVVPPDPIGYRPIGSPVTISVGGLESRDGQWRAALEFLIDSSADLRSASKESLRRHAIDTYIAALERARAAAGE